MSEKESDFIKSLKRVAITFLCGLGLLMIGGFAAFYNQSLEDRAIKTTEIQFIKRDILEMKSDIKDIKNNYRFEPKENLLSQTK